MNKSHTTKLGYKLTPLGWFPEEWEIKELSSFVETYSGGTPSRSKNDFYNGNIPWIKSGELNQGYIIDIEENISEEGLKNSSAKIVEKDTLLIALYGATSGIPAITGITAAINQAVLAIIPDNKIADKSFLYNWFLSNRQKIILTYCQGGQPNLSSDIINHIQLPLPPLPEQRAIAAVLSAWDKAIEKTQALIAQKERRKKWLMQQLLTGKKRLKGFSGAWKNLVLRELFDEIHDTNDGGDNHSIMTISSRVGLISQEDKFDRVIAGDSLKKYTQLKRNDFAYNKGNSKSYQMGCIYQLEEKESALVPFVYICFRPKDRVYSPYYKYWFLSHGLDRQLKSIITSGARGDGLLNVDSEEFFELEIPYPSVSEQTAISTVLQTADNEIRLLKNKLDKLKEQKRGLMQVLLTGKIRVKNVINN